MAFAYRPLRFDDPVPVNSVTAPVIVHDDAAELIAGSTGLIVLDGIATARFADVAQTLAGTTHTLVDVTTLYRDTAELAQLFEPYLPLDRTVDPELSFGRLFDQTYNAILDPAKVDAFIQANTTSNTLLFGLGAADPALRQHATATVFVDLTPKDAALRVFEPEFTPLSTRRNRGDDEVIRQAFFVDLELSTRHRAHLIRENALDGYILDSDRGFQPLTWKALQPALAELTSGPFRGKPVYVEGVWGGQFIKHHRGIPDDLVDKVAWAFELIPTEASMLIRSHDTQLDMPFMTIMDAVGRDIVGDANFARFDGRFPARFNYDDTWHSNGNLSVQVHPSDEMIQAEHGDIAAQNEAYYVVLTGHGAKTYVGFRADADPHEFLELCRRSAKDGSPVRYEDYIYAVESVPGRQVFLPHGTVHASGRNQLVLELGTITSGAYTYKLYDYLRPDITGRPRPIHTALGERALAFDRDAGWVDEHVAFPARKVARGEGWVDYLVGRQDDMYIEAHRIEIAAGQIYRAVNATGFTVVTIVDGESARIQAPGGGGRVYDAGYLDVIVVPASMPAFEVAGHPRHPTVIHTTCIRQDRFETWQTS